MAAAAAIAAMRASFSPFLVLSAPYSIRAIHDAALAAAFAAAAADAVTARWSAATALPCLTRLSNFDPCLHAHARLPAFLHAKSCHSAHSIPRPQISACGPC